MGNNELGRRHLVSPGLLYSRPLKSTLHARRLIMTKFFKDMHLLAILTSRKSSPETFLKLKNHWKPKMNNQNTKTILSTEMLRPLVSSLVRHIDLSWNQIEVSILLMYQKLRDVGLKIDE